MPYKMIIITVDGEEIINPFIVPNNPSHDMNSYSIPDAIAKTGVSMLKYLKDVKEVKSIYMEE